MRRKFHLVILLIFLGGLITSSFLASPIDLSREIKANGNKEDVISDKDIGLSSIGYEYSGVGKAWNVTHYANRTDKDLPVSFSNGSFGMAEIPLGGIWEGYRLQASIDNLYDTRNWCNGTFSFGDDDDSHLAGDDDSSYTNNNPYQNWTFGSNDIQSPPAPGWADYQNTMSGNYFDSNFINSSGRDCIEFRMDGDDVGGGEYGYNEDDVCWWNTTFNIERGEVIDSELQFDVRVYQMMDQNTWELKFELNDEKIYSISTYTLEQECGGSWKTFSIPQRLWKNSSNVFVNPANSSSMDLNISLRYSSFHTQWNEFEHRDFQQVFLDNVKVITTAEALPEQIGLEMNQTNVNNIDWGKGYAEINGNWDKTEIFANFSSDQVWDLGNYSVSLTTDLNLFAIKNLPETNYETNYNSIGTYFTLNNNSDVNWESYVYFSVLNGYTEDIMTLSFPTDINITEIYEPQDPNTNRLSECDNSTPGLLYVPVENISSTPNGYWTLRGISPNYCESIETFNNNTGGWIVNKTYNTGDYINISVKIIESSEIASYKQLTQAELQIKLPNGSIWVPQTQLKNLDSSGYAIFDPIQIPQSPPYYEVGSYDAIVTWNNSYSTYEGNETGYIYTQFNVIHESKLEPDQGIYFIDNLPEDGTKNIKVSFSDKEDDTAIENGTIYTYFNAKMLNFSEISPGLYLLEFNNSEGSAGNNTLMIQANATHYLDSQFELILNIDKTSNLTIESTEISYAFQSLINLTARFQDKDNNHITTATLKLIGEGLSFDFIENSPSEFYSVILDTALLDIGDRLFTIYAEKSDYESKTEPLRLNIRRIQTNLSVSSGPPIVEVIPGQNATIRVTLEDLDFISMISGASITYIWEHGEGEFVETTESGVYEAVIPNVPAGTYTIKISAFKTDDYDFLPLYVTLNAIQEEQNVLLYQILIIVAMGAFLGLGVYFVYYKKVLKFPKPVRKTRKFKSNLKSKNLLTQVELKSRENAFQEQYSKFLSSVSKEIQPTSTKKDIPPQKLSDIKKKIGGDNP